MRVTHRPFQHVIAHPRPAFRRNSSFLRLSERPVASCKRWSSTSALERQWSTPLAKSLTEAISITGPVSIAHYMRQCLTSSEGGYYTRNFAEGHDQFGKTGDFVTSPEISQIFGELVGIWFLAEWMAQGERTSGVQLMELGPGRGTLMNDVLRTISNFKPMSESIESLYLVEASGALRNKQHELLGGSPLEEHKIGYKSKSKHLPKAEIVWTEDVELVPKDANKSPFVIAHEYFDALPIHAFQSIPSSSPGLTTSATPGTQPSDRNEWRELLVSPTAPASPFTPMSERRSSDFELTVSPRPTAYSDLLPNISTRYQALASKAGSTIEISPNARSTVALLAELIGGAGVSKARSKSLSETNRSIFQKRRPSGAALIIDYGPSDTIPLNSLRGIREHKLVSPFHAPGAVDLSVDVDFGALVEAALEGSEAVEVHGPVEQWMWLEMMGGQERKHNLMTQAQGNKEVEERIRTGWERIAARGINGMGRLYKAMAIVPESRGQRKPVGFGGDVTS